MLHCFSMILLGLNAQAGTWMGVTGDAEIQVEPDRVVLTLGVESRDRNLATAKENNDRGLRSVLRTVQQLGVDAGDVQTDFIQVEIRYQSSAQTIVDHYVVNKSIAIVLKNVSKFEELITAALEAGANHVHGVEFQTTELRKHRDQARALAVKAAMEKAQDMASAAGLTVKGKPLGISSYSFGGGSWYGRSGGMRGAMAQNVYQTGGGGNLQGTMALGKISVTASVAMSFQVE